MPPSLSVDTDTDELHEKLAELQRENQLLEMENNLLTLCSDRLLQANIGEQDADKSTNRKASRKSGKKERCDLKFISWPHFCCALPKRFQKIMNFVCFPCVRLPQELTLLQKHEVANTEGELAKAQIDECKNVSEKLIDDLRVRFFDS
jgi:hypothetical protein